MGEHHTHLTRRLHQPFNTYEGFLREIHEKAPHIRIGVLSGEFPVGYKEVIGYGADFYIGGEELLNPENLGRFLSIIEKGPVSSEEIKNRGGMVETLEGKLYRPGFNNKETFY